MNKFLWLKRETPPLFSKRWFIVWAKRLLSALDLIKIEFNRWYCRSRGATIGDLSIVSGLDVNGKYKNLIVGSHSFISAEVHLATHAEINIGSYVCINSGVRLLSASHVVADPKWRMYSKPIIIGDYAWIATGAIILPGVTVGKGAVVGAGSVITKDVPPYAVASGNPAVIRIDRRNHALDFDPVIFAAPYEAWIGRNAMIKAG